MVFQWFVLQWFHLVVCSYHVSYAFQSESKLYSSLNVKKLLARNRREIWSLSHCNWTRTHNHLVRKGTLNHLAKLASFKKRVRDMIRTYSQMHRTNMYSQHSSITKKGRPVWLNGWVCLDELSGCGFESSCSDLNFPWYLRFGFIQ